jgi:hypothetical protein
MRLRTFGLSRRLVWALFLLGFAATRMPAAADPRGSVRLGAGFGGFSRTITWDDGAHESNLAAGSVAVRGEFTLRPGLAFELAAGLSMPNFDGLVFRGLPISVDYEAGAVNGVLLGAAVRARLLTFGAFEIGADGRFVYSLGLSKTWTMTGFAVEGTVTGSPSWFDATVGPRISYTGAGRFVPFATIAADWLSGTFTMDQALGDLTGHEAKKVQSKGFLAVSLGADWELSARVLLRGEAGILPYSGGTDLRASLAVFYRF